MFAVLCVLMARQKRVSKHRQTYDSPLFESRYNDLKEDAVFLPSKMQISET